MLELILSKKYNNALNRTQQNTLRPLALTLFMSSIFLKLASKFSCVIGKLDRYSEEHMRFLSSGYLCPQCNEVLVKGLLSMPTVVIYDENDNTISALKARSKGKYFGCPHCGHRWVFRDV